MSYVFPDLIIIALLVLGYMHWSRSLKVKEMAFKAVQRYCRQSEIQMLDDYIALNAFWCKRNPQGKFRAWRSYLFEFTASGNERFQGRIVYLGEKLQFIQLDPVFQAMLEAREQEQKPPTQYH